MADATKKAVLTGSIPTQAPTGVEKPAEGILNPGENAGSVFSAGAGLLSSALPSGFTDAQRAAVSQAGQTIGNVLQDRFFKSQAADWEKNDLAQFKQASSAFYNSLGTIEDEDQMAQAAIDWQMNTFDPFMTKASLKYAKNPYVMGTINEAKDRWLNGLDNFMGWQEKAWEKNQQPAKEADLEAGTDLKKAQAEESRARATALRKEASKSDKQDDPYKDWPFPPAAWTDPVMQRLYARQMGAKNPDLQKTWDSETVASAVEFEVRRRALARDTRPDGKFWGSQPEEDKTSGAASDSQLMEKELRADPENFQGLLESGRIVKGLGPGMLQAHGGYYDRYAKYFTGGELLTPEEKLTQKQNQLRGNQPTANILGVVTTLGPKEFEGIDSMDQFIEERLPEITDPSQLGGSIADVFQNAVKQDAYGNYLTRLPARDEEGKPLLKADGTPKFLVIEDYKQLVQALQQDFLFRIVGTLTAQDASSKLTRTQLMQLGEALTKKFAPQVARELDPEGKKIKLPKNLESKQFKGIFPWLKETIGEGTEKAIGLLPTSSDKDKPSQIGILPR